MNQSSSMRRRSAVGGGENGIGDEDGDFRHDLRRPSLMTRAVNAVFAFVRLAEFEILFFLFLIAAFLIFKDLSSRPEYNQILVKKPEGHDFWS